MKRVALHTLGCKLNYAETSTIGRQFVERGFDVVESGQASDVFILNTCSVTEKTDRECRQIIRRTLRHSPDAYVIVVGCYAQLQPEEIASIDGVDLVLGTKEKFSIFNYTGDFVKKTVPHVFVSCIDESTEFTSAFSAEVGGRSRAFLKIQDGCDYNCTFCTIPLARGGSRSQPIDDVLREAFLIASQGYKEIVLTGVNVGDYGKNNQTRLLDLLKALDTVDGIERIRISSIEPNLLTENMIDFILRSEKFCNHFHIPLQSGSDTILKSMRRRYLSDYYQTLIGKIKDKDASAGIGVDVIVGFPGESDELFHETYIFLANLPISYLHVFSYSEREHTPATELSGSVEPRIRAQRSEVLRTLSQRKRQAFYSSFMGKQLPVLFESNLHEGLMTGLTKNYIRVETSCGDISVNEIRNVRIQGMRNDACEGTVESKIVFEQPVYRSMYQSPVIFTEQPV